MGYWSFLPDFPTPDEQIAWANQQANAEETEVSEPNGSAARRRIMDKSVAVPGTSSIAGDDAIVEYDASAGRIGTGAGKVFFIDKAGAEAHAIQGYDLPVTFRYICDQSSACTLTHGGVVIAHAKLNQ
jgi:hypothetical protein